MATQDKQDGPDTTSAPAEPVCVFKKPVQRKNTRKRTGDDSASTDDTPSIIVQQKKASKEADNITHHATSKAQAIEAVRYQSSGTASSIGGRDQNATAILETETEFDRDGVAIKNRNKGNVQEAGGKDDGLYHGLNQYKSFIQKREEASGVAKGAGIRAGPVRASSHIRVTARFDYQPDLCKDYKETGYCGYGDSCKFMHDRGDYKTGWQLEREWDEAEKVKTADRASGKKGAETAQATEEEDDDLPFACFICRGPFKNPVITRCKHIFCERCALDNHAKTTKCFVCNEPTGGTFNVPSKQIRTKLAKKQQQMEEKMKQEEEAGGGESNEANEASEEVEA